MLEPGSGATAAVAQRTLEEGFWLEQLSVGHGVALVLGGGLVVAYAFRRFGRSSQLGLQHEGLELGSWGGRELLELVGSSLALFAFMAWMWSDLLLARGLGALKLNAVCLSLSALVALGLALQSDGRVGLRALGLCPGSRQISGEASPGSLLFMAMGLGSYVLLSPLLLGVYLLWPTLASQLGFEVADQDVLVEILSLEGGELGVAFFLAAILGPFLEELLFRGFLQPILVRSLGPMRGIVLTSMMFAWIHGASVFLPIFVLSLLLGWVQLRTRSLWASWAVHAGHNGLILSIFMLAG